MAKSAGGTIRIRSPVLSTFQCYLLFRNWGYLAADTHPKRNVSTILYRRSLVEPPLPQSIRFILHHHSYSKVRSAVARFGRRLGNELYKVAFPIYRPLYSVFKSYTDRTERRLLARNLSPGSVVVDAGANIGIYSQFLARCVGPAGVVHSFEPSPENFARLYAALSQFPNVRLNQLAVGDKTGESLLYVSDELNVDHRAYPTEGETRRTVPIRSTTLDDYFKSGERVDFIKMDVQGYELHALRGAKRVVQENPDIKLLLEFWPYGLKQAGTRWEEVIEMLRHFGMDVVLVDKNILTPFDAADVRTDISWYVNLFASRELERAVSF
jgi:FkbM family methyltransferase